MTSSEQSSKDLQASETASQATAEATRETVESATIEAKNEEIAALRSHLSEEHGQLMGMHEHVAQLLGELAIAVGWEIGVNFIVPPLSHANSSILGQPLVGRGSRQGRGRTPSDDERLR